ncbi:hypothetical protein ACE6H2_004685 [Prunus campanulata]
MKDKSSDPETESYPLPMIQVVGYLNSKQAALFKRMIWEAMNKDCDKRLSSKINYDALDKLNEELGYAPAFEEGTKSNCGSRGDMQLSNEKNSFEGSHDDDFEHESNGYNEEDEARQGHDDDTYVANDEYNGCNYDDEYNYDEECDFN